MTRIPLTAIAFDAGTQIRAAIDAQVVTDYAEAMTSGAVFPPIVLFHDGTQHYLADGFHRFLAAQRNAFRDIDAEVQAGTKDDALWYALGANKTNGKRLTEADKRHAITVALRACGGDGGKSSHEIAAQIGCSAKYVRDVETQEVTSNHLPKRERVTGRDGKSYPSRYKPSDPVPAQPFKSREAIEQRREQMRTMAAEGHTSRQIAATLGLSDEGCRKTLRAEGIDVPADKTTHHTRHHDSNRIVDRIAMDASNLTEGVNLIEFGALDPERLGEWIDTLVAAKKSLDTFIRRLVKEQEKHEAA